MRQEKSNKKLAITFWALSIICMGVIFWLSSRTAPQSQKQSSIILDWLISIFGDSFFTSFIVRKAAHCLEYTGLGLLLSFANYFTNGKKLPIIAVCIASLYAVTDELHQIFVEGRSCQFSDWIIDTIGATLGAIAFLVILAIIDMIVKRTKNKSIDTKNI